MVIKELNLEHFGKFHQKKIVLKDGINLVYGNNEDGKSTIHSFVKGMLFGIEKARGREAKDDLYSRYQPWDMLSLYSGSLDLSLESKNYRIYRNFYKEARQLSVTDTDTGQEKEVELGQPLELLGGLNKSNYANTISIEQLKMGTDKTLAMEVQNYIANIAASKSVEVDVSKAYISLANAKKELLANQTEQKMIELENKILESQRQEKQVENSYKELQILEKETKLSGQAEREEVTALEEYIAHYFIIREKYHSFKVLLEELEHQATEEESRKKVYVRSVYLSFGTILLLVALLIGGLILQNSMLIKTSIIMAIGISTMMWVLKARRETAVAKKEENTLKSSLKEKAQILKAEILAYANRVGIENYLDENTMQQLHNAVDQMKQLVEKKKKEMQQGQETRKLAMEKQKWEINLLEEQINEEEELQSYYEGLMKRQKEEAKKLAAIDLAIKTIDKIAVDIHESFAKKLNERISKIVLQETKGAYSKIFLDEQFNIRLESQQRFVNLERLSVGTIHQVYFALRLAVTELLFSNQLFPIILDEPFAYFDDERLLASLQMLLERQNQIIIFTCHTREKEMLEKLDINYNLIML